MTDNRYYLADGTRVSLDRLCREEPAWAASRLRTMEDAIRTAVAAERAWCAQRCDLEASRCSSNEQRHCFEYVADMIREHTSSQEGR